MEENITDALKMAAAILLFVGALSIAMVALTKANQASKSIMSSDDVSSYGYESNLTNVKFTSVREVGIDTVIPNIYSYYQNFNTILFYTASDESLSDMKPLTLYYTDAIDYTNSKSTTTDTTTQLDKSILRVCKVEGFSGSNNRAIYGLDINDERAREEPWANDSRYYKLFLDALVNCGTTPAYSWSRQVSLSGENVVENHTIKINFKYGNTSYKWKDFATNRKGRFIERIGRYNYETMYDSQTTTWTDEEVTTGSLNSVNNADAQIVFDNGESIDNENATEKMIIQYIYIGQSN